MKKIIVFLLVGAIIVVVIAGGIYFHKQQNQPDYYLIGYVGGDKIYQFVDAKAGAICWIVNGDLTCLAAKTLGIEKRELNDEWEEYLITTMRR